MISDREAFLKVKGRLEGEVGRLLGLVEQNPSWTPFWTFLRTALPIAESIGDLLYRDKPTKNLTRVLKQDLAIYNSNYQKVGALIVKMYRHSLIHQDELRSLSIKNYMVAWHVEFNSGHHLEVKDYTSRHPGHFVLYILFDLVQFYKDLVRLCEEKSQMDFGGEVGKRYEAWTHYALDPRKREDQEAIRELQQLTSQDFGVPKA